MKTFVEFKRRVNDVNVKLINEIYNKQWPLLRLSLKKEAAVVIEDLQRMIAQLSSKGKQKFALKYVEHFCFSLVICVYAVEKIRIINNQEIAEMNVIRDV